MSKHTHVAVHTIHRRGKDGKLEVIDAGKLFTPADKDQAAYLIKEGAARVNPGAAAEDAAAEQPENGGKGAAGKKGGKKGGTNTGAGSGSTEDDELV